MLSTHSNLHSTKRPALPRRLQLVAPGKNAVYVNQIIRVLKGLVGFVRKEAQEAKEAASAPTAAAKGGRAGVPTDPGVDGR